jgi:hypothetical protein
MSIKSIDVVMALLAVSTIADVDGRCLGSIGFINFGSHIAHLDHRDQTNIIKQYGRTASIDNDSYPSTCSVVNSHQAECSENFSAHPISKKW